MPDAVYQIILPLCGLMVVAAIAVQRFRLFRQTGRDPVVIRPFRRQVTAHGYLESALSVGAPLLAVDVFLNAVAPAMVVETLAIPVLRSATALGYIGLVFIVSGMALSGAAVRQMGASWRIGIDRDKPGALVTAGLFSRTRHPIYAGMLLVTSGMAAATADALSVAVAAAAWVGIPVQARLEEEFLLSRHGSEYQSYLAKTGRFWPKRRAAE